MGWNYTIFLLLIAGVISSSECKEMYNKKNEEQNDEFFNITLQCCGYRAPPSARKPRQSDHGINDDHSRLHKRDTNETEPRVVGGQAATNAWPWMTLIFEKRVMNAGLHLCAGTLISRKYVLTAAHCFDDVLTKLNPAQYVVKVGSVSMDKGQQYALEKILVHPNHHQFLFDNDIALLKIKGEVDLIVGVYPVCLPSKDSDEGNPSMENKMTVTGWGFTQFEGEASKVLQEVKVPVVPLEKCQKAYEKVSGKKKDKSVVTLDNICAGFDDGGKDACQGDSGGPLVKGVRGFWFQFGIVSFGQKCAEPGFPGVYTRISRYTKWLYENTDLKEARRVTTCNIGGH